jgi:hypothetical protein
VNESDTPIDTGGSSSPAAGRSRRRAPARKAPPRPKTARRPRRAPSAGSKSASRSRSAARGGGDLQRLLRSLADKATDAGDRIAAVSGQGAQATRRAWRKVSGVSRTTIDRLTADWKQMDPVRKAQFVAALLTALAAASAPLVRRGLKKR